VLCKIAKRSSDPSAGRCLYIIFIFIFPLAYSLQYAQLVTHGATSGLQELDTAHFVVKSLEA